MLKPFKLSGKRTVTGQNSGELYTKKHRRGNSWFLGKPILSLLKRIISYIPNPLGRIFQVKRQIIFLLCLFYWLKEYI